MAERLLGTIYFWSVQMQLPEKRLRAALADLEADGLRGESQKQFYLSTVLQAMEEIGSPSGPAERLDLDQERARLAKQQADKIEMENAVKRGELAYLPDVEKTWAQKLSNFRARMLAAPSKLAPQVNAENPNLARDLIAAEHEAILAELAGSGLEDEPEQLPAPDRGPVADHPPAAAADGEPVGGPAPHAQRRKQRRARKVEH